jgi:signal-transduction protein with cAMP-binding, CBS, and nucleotidyltransferase domain
MQQSVAALLKEGGVIVYTTPHTSVLEAARKMAFHNVSSILVMQHQELVGIFTERDAVRRVMVPGLNPAETPIEAVMTPDVIAVTGETPLGEVHQIMRNRHIRHLPVFGEGQLLGVISLRDVLRYVNQEQAFELDQLRDYLVEKPYPAYPR